MVMIILVVTGFVMGSFVNALVWRIHEQTKKSKSSKLKAQNYSIVSGRSMCPDCRHQLAWYDLFPVVSWLMLGGKCRYCHKPIGYQYPLVELITVGLFIISYVYWPYATTGIRYPIILSFWLMFVTIFVALAVYDLRWRLLPNRLVYPLIVLAIGQVLIQSLVFDGGWTTIISAVLGVVCLAGLFYGLFQVSAGRWIGGGDVKLAVVLGLLAGGAAEAFLLLFIASLLGTFVSLPLLVSKKIGRKQQVPFGPYLIAAMFIVYLFGSSIIGWYKRQFLIV